MSTNLKDGWYHIETEGERHLYIAVYKDRNILTYNNGEAPGVLYAGHKYIEPEILGTLTLQQVLDTKAKLKEVQPNKWAISFEEIFPDSKFHVDTYFITWTEGKVLNRSDRIKFFLPFRQEYNPIIDDYSYLELFHD